MQVIHARETRDAKATSSKYTVSFHQWPGQVMHIRKRQKCGLLYIYTHTLKKIVDHIQHKYNTPEMQKGSRSKNPLMHQEEPVGFKVTLLLQLVFCCRLQRWQKERERRECSLKRVTQTNVYYMYILYVLYVYMYIYVYTSKYIDIYMK